MEMKLAFLIVIMALALQANTQLNRIHQLDSFLGHRLVAIKDKCPFHLQTLLLIAVGVVTPTVLVGLITAALNASGLTFVSGLLQLIVLIVLFNLDNISGRIQSFQSLINDEQLDEAQKALGPLVKILRASPELEGISTHQGVFYARHALIYGWFAFTFIVIFAYVLSGITGAVLVASAFFVHRHTGCISLMVDILEWIPSRLLALSYVLLGNYNQGFPTWIDTLKNPLLTADQVLARVADAACDCNPNPDQKLSLMMENLTAIDKLITRSGLSWLILLGVLVLFRLV